MSFVRYPRYPLSYEHLCFGSKIDFVSAGSTIQSNSRVVVFVFYKSPYAPSKGRTLK